MVGIGWVPYDSSKEVCYGLSDGKNCKGTVKPIPVPVFVPGTGIVPQHLLNPPTPPPPPMPPSPPIESYSPGGGRLIESYIASAPSQPIEEFTEPVAAPAPPEVEEIPPPRTHSGAFTFMSAVVDASRSRSAEEAVRISRITGENIVRGIFGL